MPNPLARTACTTAAVAALAYVRAPTVKNGNTVVRAQSIGTFFLNTAVVAHS